MKTPIYDFAKKYAESGAVRFHMPGHKGAGPLGIESHDLTEIIGADDLFSPDGIIRESEENASRLFGTAHTLYSTEGSTLAIKTMLALASEGGGRILAARSAHKAFIHAAALLDFEFEWLYSDTSEHLCDGAVTPSEVDAALSAGGFSAVYITSPDYLGNIADIEGIARVAHSHGALLIVDNAHGAYLAFLDPSLHPIRLGADMCCDSAHKTLPVLTGGAYLHLAGERSEKRYIGAKRRMSLFASSSPSYLILESLDLCNARLSGGYSSELLATVSVCEGIRRDLRTLGYEVRDSEPLKVVISPLSYGYTGAELCAHLRDYNIHIEFCDPEYCVLMLTPDNTPSDVTALITALSLLPRRTPICRERITIPRAKRVLSPRSSMLSERVCVSVRESVGRICASSAVSCPPAIPIVACGELISREAVEIFEKYDIHEIEVVKNDR